MFCGMCGNEFSDDFRFCPKCGRAVAGTFTTRVASAAAAAPAPARADAGTPANPPSEPSQVVPVVDGNAGERVSITAADLNEANKNQPGRSVLADAFQAAKNPAPLTAPHSQSGNNIGTIVFAVFSGLSVLVSLIKGIVPIYLLEAALWGGLAFYWYKRKPSSAAANATGMLLAIAVAAGEGFLVGRQAFGDNYTYLSQGNRQYRIDNRSGRTDVLSGSSGWQPVSFNGPAQQIPDPSFLVGLQNGTWESGTFGAVGKICFDVKNDSGYVVRQVSISVSLDPPPADDAAAAKLGYPVDLEKYYGGLLDTGQTDKFCGTAPRVFPTGAKWSYSLSAVKGWKR